MKQTQQQKFLSSSFLLRYLTTQDDDAETLILCNPSQIKLNTTDQNVYEALGSASENEVNINKLKKLFEVVEIVSYEQALKKKKTILTEKKVESGRKFLT